MVPIDDYACNKIAQAGRTDQISQPVNGERNVVCPGEPSPQANTSMKFSPASTSAAPVETSATSHAVAQPKEAAKAAPMQLTCSEAGSRGESVSSGSYFILNCTMST